MHELGRFRFGSGRAPRFDDTDYLADVRVMKTSDWCMVLDAMNAGEYDDQTRPASKGARRCAVIVRRKRPSRDGAEITAKLHTPLLQMKSIASLFATLALLARTVTAGTTCVQKSWDFHDASFGPITQYDGHPLFGFNVTAVGSSSQTFPDGTTVNSDRQLTFGRPSVVAGTNDEHTIQISTPGQSIFGISARIAVASNYTASYYATNANNTSTFCLQQQYCNAPGCTVNIPPNTGCANYYADTAFFFLTNQNSSDRTPTTGQLAQFTFLDCTNSTSSISSTSSPTSTPTSTTSATAIPTVDCTRQSVKTWDFHDALLGPITQYDNHALNLFNVTAVSGGSQTLGDGSTINSVGIVEAKD
ncbi:MAG: hypothetical protein M1826_002459 [Phylliscum demangeonii]|nr:MAG: hypothetical protein M1826_002459 [Phylliscum demangeonii]